MKKVITITLILILIVSFCIPVFANELTDSQNIVYSFQEELQKISFASGTLMHDENHHWYELNYNGNLSTSDKEPHQWKDTSDLEKGISSRCCLVCEREEIEILNEPPHMHSYVSTVVLPTCIDKGYTKHTCTVCSESYTNSEVQALGHDEENAKVEGALSATCKKDGKTGVLKCGKCEEIIKESEVIKKLGHAFNKNGKCERCGVDKSNPDTGDSILNAVYTMVSSMIGLVTSAFIYTKYKNT